MVIQAHAQFNAVVSDDNLRGRKPAELQLCYLVVLPQNFAGVLEDAAKGGLWQRHDGVEQI